MLFSKLLLYFGKHASCYVPHFCCTSVSTLHATFITAKTVRKLKWWKRIAGAVASRGICHMFISWWCLLAPHFLWDLWKIIVLRQWELKMHVEHPQKNANTKVFTKTNITMNMNIDENAGPISGPFGCLCMYMYAYLRICMCMYANLCICMYMYVCVCMRMYLYVLVCNMYVNVCTCM